MAKIDTSGWKPFVIGDLFEISRPVTRSQAKYEEGDVAFVASGNFNNGVTKWCESKNGEVLDEGNCITVSPLDGAAFYQKESFLGRGGAGSAILMLRNKSLDELSGLFISSVIRGTLTKYTYSDQLNSQSISEECILLPVDADGNPDWVYMDEYMSEAMSDAEASLEKLRHADGDKHAVDVSEWREFVIGDLFDVVKGTRLTKANMIPGETRFIGSSALNNGCTAMVGNTDNVHPSNTITVCYNGSVGETFYQDEPFLASDDVNVLYPKFDMNREIALFIVPLIKAISARYNYIDKWKQEVMAKDKIMLPVDADGVPDWAYMDEYMRSIMENTEADLTAIQSVI